VKINLSWDQSQLDVFTGLVPKKLAYATVNAIANTALAIQQAEFARARQEFTIRRQSFFFGSGGRVGGVAARITQFPSVKKGIAYAEIEAGTLPKGGDELSSIRRLLYAKFEEGGVRTPFTPGAKSVAEPVVGGPARPSKTDPIAGPYTFARLQLRAYYKGTKLTRQTRSRANLGVGILGEYGRLKIPTGAPGIQWKGKERTFILFSERLPLGGVFQRVGPKDIRLVWAFHAPFPIDHRLQFIATAQRVAGTFFVEECQRQVQDVLTHDVLKAVRFAE
jgi:hypothetical protein